jgi:hypothetical protein
MLFSIFYTLADGFRILGRLAQAKANMTIAVPNDHKRPDAKAPAALDHLGHAAHLHHCLFQV